MAVWLVAGRQGAPAGIAAESPAKGANDRWNGARSSEPQSEFEKDVLKVVIAKESGNPVRRLMFISRADGEKKCSQPERQAVFAWPKDKHGLTIEVHDLPGAAQKRKRAHEAR